ncbi:MAG: prephenate dehydratase [Nitrospira sp.]|nr:prephenate dehydratase [bacterium]MBL7049561.1 prephenate dehydratase [Nitrospira sp.]
MSGLKKFRDKIDNIDSEILELLNKRTEVVLDVKKAKQTGQITVYSPAREREILKRLTASNRGPFPNETLKLIYREILSSSVSLQQPLAVSYLGPAATYTHLSAKRQFGASAIYQPESTIRDVFTAVSDGSAQYGVVPIENSNEGVVNYTLDMFMDFDLKIAFEIMLKISHNLMSKTGKKSSVKHIYSHPQATAQCRRWLERNFPGVTVIDEASTADAARKIAKQSSSAAIASELAASEYKLKIIKKGIEDYKNNYTRFMVIAKSSTPKTGRDKTSIMFSIKDRAGALYSIMQPFAKHKISLTKIESRPSKRKAWEYIFFVDMEGHTESKKVSSAIEEIKKDCLFLKVLGSYPSGE